jgi:hypothetical protein
VAFTCASGSPSSYPTFRPQALAQGLKVATYHFFRSSSPADQARFYLAYAKPEEGERVVCDWEDDECSPDMVVTFLKTIQSGGCSRRFAGFAYANAFGRYGARAAADRAAGFRECGWTSKSSGGVRFVLLRS